MIVRLLEEKKEDSSKTVSRFRTFVKWLSVNAMETDMKEKVLKSMDFNHFTTRELATDVKMSGLYSKDRIIERMQELYETNDKEVKEERNLLEQKHTDALKVIEKGIREVIEEKNLLEQKHVDALKVIEKEIREDMKAVRDSVVLRGYDG